MSNNTFAHSLNLPGFCRMRYVAAYLLAALGGNGNPGAKDIKKILESVGIEADDTRLDKVQHSLLLIVFLVSWQQLSLPAASRCLLWCSVIWSFSTGHHWAQWQECGWGDRHRWVCHLSACLCLCVVINLRFVFSFSEIVKSVSFSLLKQHRAGF